MTGATICSGIGAPETAAPWINWKWSAEIEPFPSEVLAVRHPGSVNLGDVTAADFVDRAAAFGAIDLLVAGTPCQAFSVAGKRESLADDRGNLTLRFVQIIHAIKPRCVLWENVPGVLSTHDNAFGCFLAGLVGDAFPIVCERGWQHAGVVSGPRGTAAWRVLDAQYFRVAQRRKRVFVVFSPGASGIDPAEVLFEFASMRRDTPPSRETREAVAPTISARTKGGGGLGTDFDCDGGLVANCLNAKSGTGRIDGESETFIAHALRADGFDTSEDGTGRGTPLVSQTITAEMYRSGGATAGNNPGVRNCFPVQNGATHAVRRLMPVECEALQGFPRNYTAIERNGKPAADGPRYKALGNSMAVPVVRWIIQRITAVMEPSPHERGETKSEQLVIGGEG